MFESFNYDGKLDYCDRPEQIDGPSEEAWAAINAHLGMKPSDLPGLVRELGQLRFGHIPRVGHGFCDGGSVPFEAARLGCYADGSDLKPVAARLIWGALHIVGGGPQVAEEVRRAQAEVYAAVDRQVTEWGIEHNEDGWRADAFLYCTETLCARVRVAASVWPLPSVMTVGYHRLCGIGFTNDQVWATGSNTQAFIATGERVVVARVDDPQVFERQTDISNGLGILGFCESLTSLQVHPHAASIGEWRFSKDDNVIQGVGDLNGDGIDEFIVTSDWGIGVLYHEGHTWRQLFIHPNDSGFGGWRYDSRANRIERLGDFDGDRSVEVLIASDWGIGILKQQDDSFQSPALMPSDSWFGGWHYDSSNNRIAGVGDIDGDGREEFVITSPWGIGLISLLGESFWCLGLRAYGSTIGNWLLQPNDRIVGIGNFTRSRGRELLIQAPSRRAGLLVR